MIGGIFINLVIVVCCFWVFFDAANNHIGMHTVKDGVNKGYRSGLSPIVWVLVLYLFFHSLSIYTGEKHCFLLLRNTLYKRIKALAL
jgi:hypothetical protein